MMTAWNVYRPRPYNTDRWIDTVFYTKDCDAEYVRQSLINHDGYPFDIVVKPSV